MECLGLMARFRPGNDEKFSGNLQTGRSNSLRSSLPCCRRCSLYVRFFDACTSKSLCAPIFSLFLTQLSLLHPFAALIALVSSAPLQGPPPTPPCLFISYFIFLPRRTESLCRTIAVESFRLEISTGTPFLSLQLVPPFYPISCASIFRGRPLCANIRGDGLVMKSFGGFLFESVCVCLSLSLKNEGDNDSTVIASALVLAMKGIKSYRSQTTKKSYFSNL